MFLLLEMSVGAFPSIGAIFFSQPKPRRTAAQLCEGDCGVCVTIIAITLLAIVVIIIKIIVIDIRAHPDLFGGAGSEEEAQAQQQEEEELDRNLV